MNFPEDIIAEILSRLPAEVLIRFTVVCKSWKVLISDPVFVKMHLHRSARDTSYRTRQILTNSHESSCKNVFRSFSLHSLYNESVTHATVILEKANKNHYFIDWQIIGSCNGVICLGFAPRSVLLWNPSIKKFNTLPILDNTVEMRSFSMFGFGYDSLNDDYKVVAIYSYGGPSCETTEEEVRVKVYSLRANCWKRIREIPQFDDPIDASVKYVSGTLNWASIGGDRPGADSDWTIESFDLTKETFCLVPEPDYCDSDCSGISLGVILDCLCIIRSFEGTRSNVWIMTEYGVRDSWKILFYLPALLEVEGLGSDDQLVLLSVSESGKILMKYNSDLVLLDSRKKTIRPPVIRSFDGCDEAILCIDSLVLPYAVEIEDKIQCDEKKKSSCNGYTVVEFE